MIRIRTQVEVICIRARIEPLEDGPTAVEGVPPGRNSLRWDGKESRTEFFGAAEAANQNDHQEQSRNIRQLGNIGLGHVV